MGVKLFPLEIMPTLVIAYHVLHQELSSIPMKIIYFTYYRLTLLDRTYVQLSVYCCTRLEN